MATHTDNGGSAYGRKFTISRENGTVAKDGRPFFFEWKKEIPANPAPNAKFETRQKKNGEKAHYQLFSAISGKLNGISREVKNLPDGPETWLVLHMVDGAEQYMIEVGEIDGRYSLDIMKRLLDPHFVPAESLRLSPYAVTGTDGKVSIGLSAILGVDAKLSASRIDGPKSRKNPALAQMPEPETTEFKGKTMWDFTGVSEWLYRQLQEKVVPNLDFIAEPAAVVSGRPIESPAVNDDLPF